MKRPGKIIKPTKLSEVKDDVTSLSSGQKVYNTIKNSGPITMMKAAKMANIRPRTARSHIAELVSENRIERTECPHCGTHTTYKIK